MSSILANIIEEDFTTATEIPDGFLFASIKNVGEQVAEVNDVPIEIGEAKAYPFVGKGYQALNLNPSGSKLRVLYVM